MTACLQDAQVDLNPHQIDAALFAFKSPLSKGAILADEVGLGKTIEAGIILSQQWAERKRSLLIICPSNLRKQWSQELADKFFLPSKILENKSFNEEIKNGNFNPFSNNECIIICSFQFALSKEMYVKRTNWDLVIIDEAHRLRNVYKSTNRIGTSIKNSILERKKVLLTATPLQNSILELYGLVSIIDDYIFGDLKSFKSQFSRLIDSENYEELRKRLVPICQRTLRRQVLGYIEYTQRRALVEDFYPTDDEQKLYNGVSEYLQRPVLYALPRSQRQLMTLILRKLLASSSFAIHGTLSSLVDRLQGLISDDALEESLSADLEEMDELKEEWLDDEEEEQIQEVKEQLTESEIQDIKEEIEYLKEFRDLAYNIKKNTKADKLFTALQRGFETLEDIGANKKALIFTESRRTQEFIFNLLNSVESCYIGKVILFNGTNSDPKSRQIYRDWLLKHKGTDRISGSPTADIRAALVEYFREEAIIMIATEAAAEGINLQFCSLVVNYDLPWNPQRIEQRIGRCHRYGQKHDVVVVNFLNKANAADQRVYQLLSEKFKLFDGVFGASDEV
ncbi:MAG TPA: SNF2-related protein, partial [Prolixibacteraceae bacterium]|nr:SNF2-related protein [Prolixibacteraceae bacterium]